MFTSGSAYIDEERWHERAAELRRNCPVLRVEAEGYRPFWALTRHADVMEVERRHDIFLNTMEVVLSSDETIRARREQGADAKTLVHMDDPEHKAYRAITTDWLKAGALRRTMSDQLQHLARVYVDRMAEFGGSCDFAADIASYYPLRVILSMLGIPEADEPKILRLAHEAMGTEDAEFAREDGATAQDMSGALLEFMVYCNELVEQRRKSPTADIASTVANAQIDGEPLGVLETLSYLMVFFTAGHDTTSHTLSGGLEAIISTPGAFDQLRADPGLIPNAVDEMTRWASPLRGFTRTAQQDYELHGVTIEAGDMVLLSYPSANRDEAVFEDPFRFDITRANANRNLALGFGKHYCLGAQLAKMEMQAFMTELFSRLESVEINGPVQRSAGNLISGIKHLPISYRLR
ncbi:cytochrome P450 [Mycolicibacterium sp. CH28]|uniref:cytochrome P450 n=1 Tax=Mycolicibacterium sp. CH28 TaxID=2512237 RepID=UPI00108213D4|nr:cytochrome P450 [Mycolicibacterium sp. CH28]TGD85909.1 cytochrome P450 [Mycolicibacterium sp. CH28]